MTGTKIWCGIAAPLIVFGALALHGCVGPRYSETVYFADYRPYTAEGFTISPSSSGFTYESIGDLEIVFMAGTLEDSVHTASATDDLRTLREYEERGRIYCPSYEEMTEKIVRRAQELGADALLNFRIRPIYVESSYTPIIGFTVSGFAVKLIK